MKVLVLSSHTQSLIWFRIDMMKRFVSLGHDVIAVGSESEEDWIDSFKELGVKYRQIPVSRNGLNPFIDYKTFKAIDKLISEEKPDKIFVYQAKTISYGCPAAHKNGITEVYTLMGGLGSIFRGNGLKNKLVKAFMSRLLKSAFRHSQKIFVQNNDDLNELDRCGLIDKEKVVMLNGSGVNIQKFTPTELPEIPAFLFIGRLIGDKGIHEYLEAARIIKKEYPKVKFLVVGPFDSNPSSIQQDELNKYIEDNTIEYFGPQKDVRPYISKCSVFVLPSYHEGTPKTVLESMAMGRAIITTDAPGCRETVVDNDNGLLVKVKSVDDLCSKMRLLINEPLKVKKMGERSRQIAKDKYDVDKVNSVIVDTMFL